MFEYKAILVRTIDGDTVLLDLDLGFGLWRRAKRAGEVTTSTTAYRLSRINAPELSDPGGPESKEALAGFLGTKLLVASTQKADGFGRYVIELVADGVNASDWLVEHGFAAYKTY